jgi:hypothetical protein
LCLAEKVPSWPRKFLSSLDLSATDVSDASLMSLLRMEGLTKLNLTDTRITAEGVARQKSC